MWNNGFLRTHVNMLRKMGYKVEIGLHYGERSPYWSDAECIAVDEEPASGWAPPMDETATERQ
jgi:hypothetical protein